MCNITVEVIVWSKESIMVRSGWILDILKGQKMAFDDGLAMQYEKKKELKVDTKVLTYAVY
jgi:hypothetical protein